MERLRQSDLQSLLEFVRDCYAIRDFEPFEDSAPRLVAALARLIPAAHVTYNEMFPEKSESHNCVSTAELATPEAACLWEHHMNEHPVMQHILLTGDRRAVRISDFWSERRLRDSGLHRDFYKRYGIEDALCITVPCALPRVIGAGWHDGRCFTERERLIADLARPHISQAWHNAKLLSRMHQRLQILENCIEELRTGLILCDLEGKVQFINAQARRGLVEYFGATRQTDRRLPEELHQWVRGQNLQFRNSDDAPPVRLPLIYEKGVKRLVIRLLSQSGGNLILMEEEDRTLPDARSVETLGLTVREAEVLTWIARGKTNSDIATILGMQIGTVKKHVEHLFEKLGVETRTAAATRVLANSHPHSNS
jgi:DNA-binding CsgD family transcriptional regulator